MSEKVWQVVDVKRETAEQRELWESLKEWSYEHGAITLDSMKQHGFSDDEAFHFLITLVTTPSDDGFWSMEGDGDGAQHHRVTQELCETIFQAGKRVQARQREWDARDLAKEMGIPMAVAWHYDRILTAQLYRCPAELMRFLTGTAWPRSG